MTDTYTEFDDLTRWARRRKDNAAVLQQSAEWTAGWEAALEDLLAHIAARKQRIA